VKVKDPAAIRAAATARRMNFYYSGAYVGISIDETTSQEDIVNILAVFGQASGIDLVSAPFDQEERLANIHSSFTRTNEYHSHPVFHTHHSEKNMMRYVRS